MCVCAASNDGNRLKNITYFFVRLSFIECCCSLEFALVYVSKLHYISASDTRGLFLLFNFLEQNGDEEKRRNFYSTMRKFSKKCLLNLPDENDIVLKIHKTF